MDLPISYVTLSFERERSHADKEKQNAQLSNKQMSVCVFRASMKLCEWDIVEKENW